jgi:hypothetical protein
MRARFLGMMAVAKARKPEPVPAINADLINEWHGYLWHPRLYGVYFDGMEVFAIPTNLAYCNNPAFIMVDYALRQMALSGEPYASRGRQPCKWTGLERMRFPRMFRFSRSPPLLITRL